MSVNIYIIYILNKLHLNNYVNLYVNIETEEFLFVFFTRHLKLKIWGRLWSYSRTEKLRDAATSWRTLTP